MYVEHGIVLVKLQDICKIFNINIYINLNTQNVSESRRGVSYHGIETYIGDGAQDIPFWVMMLVQPFANHRASVQEWGRGIVKGDENGAVLSSVLLCDSKRKLYFLTEMSSS